MATIDLQSFGMPRQYEELLDRSVELFIADDRAVALFVVGSVGRGEADASSDLDLVVAVVDDDAHRSLIDDWHAWATAITPWVYGRCLRDKVVSLRLVDPAPSTLAHQGGNPRVPPRDGRRVPTAGANPCRGDRWRVAGGLRARH